MPEYGKDKLVLSIDTKDNGLLVEEVIVAAAKLIYSSGDFVIFACQGGFSVKGNTTAEIIPQAKYKVTGKVGLYSGKPQLIASSIERVAGEDSDNAVIASFLVENLKGIGEKTSKSLAAEYGKDVVDVLLETPKLAAKKIAGLSLGRAILCSNTIDENPVKFKLKLELRLMGLTNKQSDDAISLFGLTAADELNNNPYLLLRIPGIGFDTCEKIAARYQIDPLTTMRLVGAIECSIINMHIETGSTCFLPEEVKRKSLALIRGGVASDKEINEALLDSSYLLAEETAVKDSKIVIFRFNNNKCEGCSSDAEGALIAYKLYFAAEAAIKKEIEGFLKAPYVEPDIDKAKAKIDKIASAMGITPDSKQYEAVLMAMSRPISIITGGPGTGKTTITGILAEHFKKENIKCEFCAPTGRAAKRLSEASGIKANTIHRLLEVNAENEDGSIEAYCRRNRENPIDARVILVDEASMIDVLLFKLLMYAIKSNASIVIIGDPNQLPSVGAGNLLSDLLNCNSIPRVELDYVFRQKDESSIASNAYRILNGDRLIGNDNDFVIVEAHNDELALNSIKSIVSDNTFTNEDVAILCPTKQNLIGSISLNNELQEIFTGEEDISFKVRNDLTLRHNDRVMQIKNNYKLEYYDPNEFETQTGVFNGEIGYIDDIDFLSNTCDIKYDDGKVVTYDKKAIADVDLAYAMTVHKAQGCEFDTVIIALGRMNYKLSSRRLLYTAVTRGKKKVIIVDSDGRLNKMIANAHEDVRRTTLSGFVKIIDSHGF